MRAMFVILLCLSCCKDQSTIEEQNVAAIINDQRIYVSTIDGIIQDQLYESLYGIYYKRRIALEEFISNELITKESNSLGIGVDSLLNMEVDSKVTKESLAKYIDSHYLSSGVPDEVNPTKLIEISSSKGQTLVIKYFKKKIKEEYIKTLMRKYNVKITLMPPVTPRKNLSNIQTYARGNLIARTKFLLITDFTCAVCKDNFILFENLYQKYKDEITFLCADFSSEPALPSILAECAGRQGKFWEMREILFHSTGQDSISLMKEINLLNLDTEFTSHCLTNKEIYNDLIVNSSKMINEGITYTPTILINNRVYYGELSFEKISEIIDKELKKD